MLFLCSADSNTTGSKCDHNSHANEKPIVVQINSLLFRMKELWLFSKKPNLPFKYLFFVWSFQFIFSLAYLNLSPGFLISKEPVNKALQFLLAVLGPESEVDKVIRPAIAAKFGLLSVWELDVLRVRANQINCATLLVIMSLLYASY